MTTTKPVLGTGGDHYIPYSERSDAESIVYFTRDLSAEGLLKIFKRISANLTGKTAIKLHTGEPHGPNIIPRPWVKNLIEKALPEAAIVETNAYYAGGRDTTEKHRSTIALTPLPLTAGIFARLILWTKTAPQFCLLKTANGLPKCMLAKTC